MTKHAPVLLLHGVATTIGATAGAFRRHGEPARAPSTRDDGDGRRRRPNRRLCGATPVWHPVYAAGWAGGHCAFVVDCDSPGYPSELACCRAAYAGQVSDACLMHLPSPPTSSPTETGEVYCTFSIRGVAHLFVWDSLTRLCILTCVIFYFLFPSLKQAISTCTIPITPQIGLKGTASTRGRCPRADRRTRPCCRVARPRTRDNFRVSKETAFLRVSGNAHAGSFACRRACH